MQHFAIGALALVLALVLPVNAQATSTTGSMKVAIDQKTGELRPANAAEEVELAQAEAAQTAASSQNQKASAQKGIATGKSGRTRPQTADQALDTARVHASGTIQVRVPQELDSEVVARRGANGELIIEESNQNGPEVVNE